jgi:hypothetical protein
MAFAHALREVSTKRDGCHACVDAVQRGFSTQVCASSSWSGRLNTLSRVLEERTTLLCV